ncbi:hypothetical protein L3V82_01475 [Thiotrichales bacterium 19S3-7]|nr:hypothetical protein [Thiotrichales bacterium 19S3-7]MCF6800833.1 hypothetical protein [Thiotrichales bacterium 19S3-11]
MFEEEMIPLASMSNTGPSLESIDGLTVQKLIEKKVIPEPAAIKDSDELRNVNSFLYLRKIAAVLLQLNIEKLNKVAEVNYVLNLCNPANAYNIRTSYGNLYTDFLDRLERIIVDLQQKEVSLDPNVSEPAKKQLEDLQPLIHAFYYNTNVALEYTALVIGPVVKNTKNISKSEGAVTKQLSQNIFKSAINRTSPEEQGSKLGRALAFVAKDFKPMLTTSIPQLRVYAYKDNKPLPLEFRFGTQAEKDNGNPRYNPLFKEFIRYQKHVALNSLGRNLEAKPITHVYFNNLKYAGGNKERDAERALSLKLHELEAECDNLAVISIPADGNFLDEDFITAVSAGKLNVIANRMEAIATNNGYDFFISDRVKALLYGEGDNSPYDKEVEANVIRDLMDQSILALGFQDKQTLTQAETQALYFHFLKYELTKHILSRLDPLSFNTSCKDAIDRGGVSSLYLNLIQSIEMKEPLTEDEFYRGLHAAPAMVKGRAMNHHVKLFANMIDHYISANQGKVEIPAWLIQWRDENKLTLSNKSEKSYKNELLVDLKTQVDNLDDQQGLYVLLLKVQAAENEADNPFRELWHQETGIPARYQGAYGNTSTASEAISYIKSRLLEVIKGQNELSDSLDSSEVFASLTEHSKRKSIFRPERTSSEKEIRRSSLSDIFDKELVPPMVFSREGDNNVVSVEMKVISSANHSF